MGSIRDHRCTTPEWRSIKSWLPFLDWVIFTLEIIFNFAESARQGKGKVLTYFKISLTHYATLDRQLGFGGVLNTVFKSSLYLCSFALKLRLNDISIVVLFVFVIFVLIFSAGIRRKHVFKSFSQSDNWHRRMSRVSLDLFNFGMKVSFSLMLKCEKDPILCCDQWFSLDQHWLMNGHV